MTISKEQNGTSLKVSLAGRLDTTTAPELEHALSTDLNGISALTFDFSALDYISSAGLRVLLSTQKTMNKQGSMVITGANDTIMEVFEITGFVDILTIQ